MSESAPPGLPDDPMPPPPPAAEAAWVGGGAAAMKVAAAAVEGPAEGEREQAQASKRPRLEVDGDGDARPASEAAAAVEVSKAPLAALKSEAPQVQNQQPNKPGGPSSYRGVHWDQNKWRVRINIQGTCRHVGRFDTAEEAARAYDEEAKQLWANPILNFLPDGSLNPGRKGQRADNLHLLLIPSHQQQQQQKIGQQNGDSSDDGDGAEGAGGGGKQPLSIYRGLRPQGKKWVATIRFQGQDRYLGSFDTEEAAARAFDAGATQTWVNPILNFLPDGSLNPNRKNRDTKVLVRRPVDDGGGGDDDSSGVGRWEEDEETVSVGFEEYSGGKEEEGSIVDLEAASSSSEGESIRGGDDGGAAAAGGRGRGRWRGPVGAAAAAASSAAAAADSGSEDEGPPRWERIGSGSSSSSSSESGHGGSSSEEEDEDEEDEGRRPAPPAALQERKTGSRRRRAPALRPFAPGQDGWYELLPVRIRNAILGALTPLRRDGFEPTLAVPRCFDLIYQGHQRAHRRGGGSSKVLRLWSFRALDHYLEGRVPGAGEVVADARAKAGIPGDMWTALRRCVRVGRERTEESESEAEDEGEEDASGGEDVKDERGEQKEAAATAGDTRAAAASALPPTGGAQQQAGGAAAAGPAPAPARAPGAAARSNSNSSNSNNNSSNGVPQPPEGLRPAELRLCTPQLSAVLESYLVLGDAAQEWFVFSFLNHFGALLEAKLRLQEQYQQQQPPPPHTSTTPAAPRFNTPSDLIRALHTHDALARTAATAASLELRLRGRTALTRLQDRLRWAPDAPAVFDALIAAAAQGAKQAGGAAAGRCPYYPPYAAAMAGYLQGQWRHDLAAAKAATAAAAAVAASAATVGAAAPARTGGGQQAAAAGLAGAAASQVQVQTQTQTQAQAQHGGWVHAIPPHMVQMLYSFVGAGAAKRCFIYYLVAHLGALLEAEARIAPASAAAATRPPLQPLNTVADLLRGLDDERGFHFWAIAVEAAAMDTHYCGTNAVPRLREGLLCHAPPALAVTAAPRLDVLATYAQRRGLDPPAAAYYRLYYHYLGWYLPCFGHRHDLAATAAAPAAAGCYVAAHHQQQQPQQPQPLQQMLPQQQPLQQQPQLQAPPLQQQQPFQPEAAAAAPTGAVAAAPGPMAAGGSDGSGSGGGAAEPRTAAAGVEPQGPAATNHRAAAPPSSSSSSLVGSSNGTVVSAVTGEGPPPPSPPAVSGPEQERPPSEAIIVGPRQLAELEALVERSIREADAVLGETTD